MHTKLQSCTLLCDDQMLKQNIEHDSRPVQSFNRLTSIWKRLTSMTYQDLRKRLTSMWKRLTSMTSQGLRKLFSEK
eukprot:1493704-Amphidinium_carterae.1